MRRTSVTTVSDPPRHPWYHHALYTPNLKQNEAQSAHAGSTQSMDLWWSLCTLYLLTCQVSYRRGLRSLLLCLCNVFWALINSLVCWPCSIQVWICNSMRDTNLTWLLHKTEFFAREKQLRAQISVQTFDFPTFQTLWLSLAVTQEQ